MRSDCERGLVQTLAEKAHILKSSNAMFGSQTVSSLCGSIGEASRTGNLDALSSLVDRLEHGSAQVLAEIRALV